MSFVKYPRTHHLPWSPGLSSDDKVANDLSSFEGRRVIVTKKMDGENTTMYNNHIHARSIDSRGGADRDWVKSFWANISHNIPDNYRICGENLWARHSIYYEDLESYFLAFSVWNGDICLSWDDTVDILQMLDIKHVPVMADIVWDENMIRNMHQGLDDINDEGFVVRLADEFNYADFNKNVVKYVRAGHVQTDQHWRTSGVFVPNKLKR